MKDAVLTAEELRRYSRHLSLAEVGAAGQLRLKAGRVLIVGVGGLGSPCALYLAAAGVGHLGLVDCDQVDESNLQRQVLYDSAQVGSSKATQARARLLALNPTISVVAHEAELAAANIGSLFADYDIIVDGSDRIATRYLVNDACVILGKSLVTAAVHRFEGQALTYAPGRGPCYRCLFAHVVADSVASCADVGVLGVLPGILGTIQATEVLKLLLGLGTPLFGQLLTLDALQMRFDSFTFARRPDCAVCGDQPVITRLQDPPGFCSIEEQRRVPQLSPVELARLLATQAGTLRLIDVRGAQEFADGALENSIHLPLPQIEQSAAATLAPLARPGDTLVFICRSGARGTRAGALARREGLHAVNLAGGLLAWRALLQTKPPV